MNRLFQPVFVSVLLLMGIVLSLVLWGVSQAERQVERAVSRNFTAAGLLARIQVEGERMRRYEKEMFIYAAAPANRAKYVKEHDESHRRLLALLTQAAAPSGTQFSDEDRGKLLAWKEATTFYGREFARIVVTADGINVDTLPTDQKLALTTRLNGEIKEGKDRFATVLKGADEMRAAKEAQSLVIEREIASVFLQLKYMMLVVSLLVVGAAAWRVLRRPGARVSPPANPRPLGLRRY